LVVGGKRHCGVGGLSGGLPPGASAAPGVVAMSGFQIRAMAVPLFCGQFSSFSLSRLHLVGSENKKNV